MRPSRSRSRTFFARSESSPGAHFGPAKPTSPTALGCSVSRRAPRTARVARLIDTEGVHALQYQGKRYDCGSKQGFLEATVELALKHEELGPEFKAYLKELSLRG